MVIIKHGAKGSDGRNIDANSYGWGKYLFTLADGASSMNICNMEYVTPNKADNTEE